MSSSAPSEGMTVATGSRLACKASQIAAIVNAAVAVVRSQSRARGRRQQSHREHGAISPSTSCITPPKSSSYSTPILVWLPRHIDVISVTST